jgi:hypothetical protein
MTELLPSKQEALSQTPVLQKKREGAPRIGIYTFPKKTNGQKMLYVTNHQRNAKQNHG